MHLGINNEQLYIGGDFSTPLMSAAVYHQSTLNDLLVKGLSLTVGLRLDYEEDVARLQFCLRTYELRLFFQDGQHRAEG